MKQIIAIGGGGFASYTSELIMERYLLAQCRSKQPRVAFLPQASAEDPRYIVSFMDAFRSLGADPTWLSLFGRVKDDWPARLLEQDMIYVGGGNTRSMLTLWREWGVDEVLKKAYQQGTVLCGVSAGAICWFEQCVTDSVWPLGVLDGLGLLEGSCCPHYDSEPERRPTFTRNVAGAEILPGIALSDQTLAHYVDGKLKEVLSEAPGKQSFWVAETERELPVTVIADEHAIRS